MNHEEINEYIKEHNLDSERAEEFREFMRKSNDECCVLQPEGDEDPLPVPIEGFGLVAVPEKMFRNMLIKLQIFEDLVENYGKPEGQAARDRYLGQIKGAVDGRPWWRCEYRLTNFPGLTGKNTKSWTRAGAWADCLYVCSPGDTHSHDVGRGRNNKYRNC